MRNGLTVFAAALLLALGVAAGGWLVGRGIVQARTGDRYVTVKGVAERAVKADLVLWPIRYVATGNDLARVQAKIEADTRTLTQFLQAAGTRPEEIQLQDLQVTDLLAQAYRSGPVESRFIVSRTVMVRSTDVDRINAASQRVGELVTAGVVLSGEQQAGPFYLFTRLNEVKPAMIAEATRSARQGAEQFAADSSSRIGGIRTASQGVFQILAQDDAPGVDQNKQIAKTVRVVSTVEYFLAD